MIIDFIGIGAARSGTTWLFYTLGQHPDICLSEPKEVLYFNKHSYSERVNNNPDKTNRNFDKSMSWYLHHFDHCKANSVKGEFSPAYFQDSLAPCRIKSQFPDVKLVLNLRNPVDRIYSSYWHRREYGKNEKRSFEYVVNNDREFVAKGYYSPNLKRYLKIFDRDKIKINLFDDIVDSPEFVLRENLRYLGLDSSFEFNLEKAPKNSAKSSRFGYVINIMGKFSSMMIDLRQSKMLGYLRRAGLKKLVFSINTRPIKYPEMGIELREYLKGFYLDDINMLEDLAGMDFTRWK